MPGSGLFHPLIMPGKVAFLRILLGKKMLILTMRVPEGIFAERIQHNVLNVRLKYKTEIHV